MARILVPRITPATRVLQVDFNDAPGTGTRPVRLAKGEQCELRYDDESGPQLVCRLERTAGPLIATTPLQTDGAVQRFDVLIDDRPLESNRQSVRPGSRVDIVERRTGRRYGISVTEPHWSVRPRFLALALLALTTIGGLYAAYVHRTLVGTESEIAAAREHVSRATHDIRVAEQLLDDVQRRVLSLRGQVARSIDEIKSLQAVRERALRAEFNVRLVQVAADAKARVDALAHSDAQAREQFTQQIEAQMHREVAEVRGEFAERMVSAYRSFKLLEEHVQRELREQSQLLAPPGPRFKTVLAQARKAVVFVRTSYDVEFTGTGETKTHASFGSGFVVSASGITLTARHVVRPWEYERELQVLAKLELVRIKKSTASWQAWPFDAVVKPPAGSEDEAAFNLAAALRSEGPSPTLRLTYVSPVQRQPLLVNSPLGPVEIQMPLPGGTDSAVLQLLHAGPAWEALELATPAPAQPLDDVLVIGFPLSRLENGRAVPQGVPGLVRRDSDELLELNIAFGAGISGGPILNRRGQVIGLASGMADALDYGLAVRGRDLVATLSAAAKSVAAEEARLAALGCNPGEIDGLFDARTLAAYRCERERTKATQ